MVDLNNTINTYEEILAYEALWGEEGASEKKISTLFKAYDWAKPSEILLIQCEGNVFKYQDKLAQVEKIIGHRINNFSVSMHNDFQYPKKLRDAKYPIEILYYIGEYELINNKSISIVGSRSVSDDGIRRTIKLTRLLVNEGFTIVSGLAIGVDAAAHKTCIEMGGKTIGVIGTPIDQYYPKENQAIQDVIKYEHLLVSQVPLYRHETQNFNQNRYFFPQRNVTMSAISEATVIVEAGETSGTLTQARAAISQNRKLFILNNLFENSNLTWPKKYEEMGAIRVREIDDILEYIDYEMETDR